jgi:hypothetical protein
MLEGQKKYNLEGQKEGKSKRRLKSKKWYYRKKKSEKNKKITRF